MSEPTLNAFNAKLAPVKHTPLDDEWVKFTEKLGRVSGVFTSAEMKMAGANEVNPDDTFTIVEIQQAFYAAAKAKASE
jgi:hypothetical protein